MDNVQFYTSPCKSSKSVHSHRMSERKRNLFGAPREVIDKETDDLGPIKLLSNSPDLKYLDEHLAVTINKSKNVDLDIDIYNQGKENIQQHISKNMSPLYISPASSTRQSINEITNCTISDTPIKGSPTQALKTPHDTLNSTNNIPRQPRKSISESNSKIVQSSKRKSVSPLASPEAKHSKARTALFPAHSFYPKVEEVNKREKWLHVEDNSRAIVKKQRQKSNGMYLCNRKRTNNRNPYGLINAGVGHKIRKPKQKKFNKTQLLKAAIKIIENSPLNEYLNSTTPPNINKNELSKEQVSRMDAVLNDITNSNDLFKNELVPITINSSKNITAEDHKRKRSPSPDPNKKFFKHTHTRATFTMSNNMKVAMDNGKMTLLEAHRKRRRVIDYSETFDCEKDEIKVEDSEITNVLNLLNDEVDLDTKITLTASTTVSGSENSILIHETHTSKQKTSAPIADPSILLSPTSEMCDMTSVLALNSPTKSQVVKNLSVNLEMCSASPSGSNFKPFVSCSLEDRNGMSEESKWFPIFYAGAKPDDAKDQTEAAKAKNKGVIKLVNKYFKNVPKDQMFLDVGQKKLDLKQCPECNIVYNMGDPEDENMHLKHHHSVNTLRFNGWKNERVVTLSDDSKERIIAVYPNDPKVWWKKVNELLSVVDKDLGFLHCDPSSMQFVKVFLYIKNRQIAGCLVTEPKTIAHKMLSVTSEEVEMISEDCYPIKCGVSRIWVAINCRKQGVATGLMNSLRKNFMFGCVLDETDIALSPPTTEGKAFATKYFKTPNFLIYTQ